MKGELKTYCSYGNIYQSTAEVFYPKTLGELQNILAFCHANGRRVTPGGSFHSFDQQNASRDVVISMQHFNHIDCNAQEGTLRVGAGATWGAIFDEVYKQQCILYTCVSGDAPTAGGTLSINSYSVWITSVGKEGKHCLSFKLMTTEGELLTCSRTENKDLFYGVIGGMGLLGFIVEITYSVLYVGSQVQIDYEIIDYEDILDLEERLKLAPAGDLSQLKNIDSYTTLFFMHQGKPQHLVAKRQYKPVASNKKGSRLRFLMAVIASGLMHFFPDLANRVIYKDKGRPAAKRLIFKNVNYHRYGTFWAQPQYHWSKKFSRFFQRLGYEPKLYQNSYFIPVGGDKVSQFVQKTYELSAKMNLQTYMFDVCYCPKDEPFVLAHARYGEGFLINTTFMEGNDPSAIMACYDELNLLALEMGGSLNLGKNCFVQPAILEQMYAPALAEFRALKDKYDPSGLITSNFFEHYFPSYFGKAPLAIQEKKIKLAYS